MPDRIGLRSRLLALGIDLTGIALLAIFFAPWVGIRLGLDVYEGQGPGAGGMMAGAAAGTVVIALLWFVPEAIWGASAGKAALSLRIGTAGGERVPRGSAALRWALKTGPLWVDLLARVVAVGLPRLGGWLEVLADLCAAGVVAGGFMILGPARQALHDLLAGTAVYRRAGLLEPAAPPDAEP